MFLARFNTRKCCALIPQETSYNQEVVAVQSLIIMNKPHVSVYVFVLVDGDAHRYVGAYKSNSLANQAAKQLGIKKPYIITEYLDDIYNVDAPENALLA